MKSIAWFILVAAVLAAVSSAQAGDNAIKLKKGDRIVFLGDSITEGGVGPKGYVTLVKNALAEKRKSLGVAVIGAGVSGNKVPDLQNRLERDVLKKSPTLVFIYIGINDVWHGENNPNSGTSKEAFEAGLKDIVGKIKATGAKVVLCTPSVIGEKTDGGNSLDAKLDEYSDITRKVAKATKSTLCDLRREFLDHLKKNNADNKDSGVLTGDRVHLNDAGNRFVADTMLKTLGQ